MAAIMATMKRIPLYRDLQNSSSGRASPPSPTASSARLAPARGQYKVLAEDLSGKTVLIVGYGSIGAAIEARLDPVRRHRAPRRPQCA
jgi:lactate dehydrogenase-like 2-hydroxyacid dehydrogenase